jgi:uncharacterized protein YcbX
MLTVTALYTYPVKSCGVLAHESIALNERGLVYDRQWMIVADEGKPVSAFVSQRDYPTLARIQPRLSREQLTLSAPQMGEIGVPLPVTGGERRVRVVVWNDVCEAFDEGVLVSEWLSAFLGARVRLVRMADDFTRLTSDKYTDQPAPVGFADGYPLLLTTQASLDDLNARIAAKGKLPVEMARFRPNVVVSGEMPAFAEDNWRKITLGAVPFDVVKPCARCSITTVNQADGTIPDVKEPTATLASYRRTEDGKVLFGQNIIHRGLGTLRVGDAVTVVL